jgi:hypothetical protein
MMRVARLSFAIALLMCVPTGAMAQQFADPEFDAKAALEKVVTFPQHAIEREQSRHRLILTVKESSRPPGSCRPCSPRHFD